MDQEKEVSKRKKVVRKLKHHYRMVILNDDNFEEKLSIRLTPMNVVTYVGMSLLVLTVLLISVIAFTPLRQYIPGYADVQTKKNALYATQKSDSLEYIILAQKAYLDRLQKILRGEEITDSVNDNASTVPVKPVTEDEKTQADATLRKEIEREEQFSVLNKQPENHSHYFFTPVKGEITSGFDPTHNHFGIDVVTKENEAIKAVLDGIVVSADWTTDNGHTIVIQHSNNIISAYKHCSVLTKKSGDLVKAGDAIAIVGNSGELTTGPHLHFELWENSRPVDPQKYILF